MRLKYICLSIMLFNVLTIKAQKPKPIIASFETVKKIIASKISWDKLKDSTAVYTFCLKINTNDNKKEPKIKCSINNPEISSIFFGFNDINNLDYSVLTKKGKRNFLVRFYILMLSSDYEKKVVDIYSVPKSVRFLYQIVDNSYEDLGVIVQQYDKKVYN